VKTCPSCGTKNRGVFPDRIVSPVQYGQVVEATLWYMSVYQYIPYKRIVRFFKDCFGLPLQEGSVEHYLEKLGNKTASSYETLRQLIQFALAVGSDETGCLVNGKNNSSGGTVRNIKVKIKVPDSFWNNDGKGADRHDKISFFIEASINNEQILLDMANCQECNSRVETMI